MRMLPSVFAAAILAITSLGTGACVSNDFVKNETLTAFKDAGDIVAHVKAKCAAASDDDCVAIQKAMTEICTRLDNLAKKAGGAGFDCANWKAN